MFIGLTLKWYKNFAEINFDYIYFFSTANVIHMYVTCITIWMFKWNKKKNRWKHSYFFIAGAYHTVFFLTFITLRFTEVLRF